MYPYTYDNLHRIAKSDVAREIIELTKNTYKEKYGNKPIEALRFSHYKLFCECGDRAQFESEYFERRARLALLQLLAIEDDGYLPELEDVLAAICDEYTWVLPAHVSLHPDICLFAAETSMYLAESDYIFADRLSPVIRERIKKSTLTKTVLPFEARPCVWESRSSNWSAVCACGVGLTYLYLFPERFGAVKDRLLKTFGVYLETIGEDGYCEEGIGYWQYGFGFFSVFFDVYVSLTGERPTLLDSEKVKNLVRYASRARLDGNVYLPYADGGTPCFISDAQVFFAIKNLFPDLFDFDIKAAKKDVSTSSRALGARLLYGIESFTRGATDKKSVSSETFYYEGSEVFIHKCRNYAFTAKGGHNDELHNHNDLGAFQIVKNEKRLIADLGAGKYTRQYFGTPEERYSIFVCNSLSHSVPIIGGVGQSYGKDSRARVLKRSDTHFSLDILCAYGGGADTLTVSYTVKQNGVAVKYTATGLKEEIIFRFVSDYKPRLRADGTVDIEGLLYIKSATEITPTVSAEKYLLHIKPNGINTDGYADAWLIDYAVTGNEVDAEFFFEVGEVCS